MQSRLAMLFAVTVLAVSGCDAPDDGAVPERDADPGRGPVTFAVYANTGHLGDDGTGRTVRSLVEAVDGFGPDFAVDLGNRLPPVFPSPQAPSLLAAIDRLYEDADSPVYPVAGENDVFDYTADIAFGRRYGPTWYAFERRGCRFVVISTEDEIYRDGFGRSPRIGGLQWQWIREQFAGDSQPPTVVFMHRPLWTEAPGLWDELVPLFAGGNVSLVVSAHDGGLFDWGEIDGIRAVSTGCAPVGEGFAAGAYPHALLVTLDPEPSFSILDTEGAVSDGVMPDAEYQKQIKHIADGLLIDPLDADPSWRVSTAAVIEAVDPLEESVAGEVSLEVFDGTDWVLSDDRFAFSLDPGDSRRLRIDVLGTPPDLGPHPRYSARLGVGGREVWRHSAPLTVAIPQQRTGRIVPVTTAVETLVPYGFGGGRLRVPVDVERADQSGRLFIYRESDDGPPECVHISPLHEMEAGINEFTWDGRDLHGSRVAADTLMYRLCVYNKEAPPTWVANGPPEPSGTVVVRRTLTGLDVLTHNGTSLLRYPIRGSSDTPEPDVWFDCREVLDGLEMTGFALQDDRRLFLGTDAGVVKCRMDSADITLDGDFAEGGYRVFDEARGRTLGPPRYYDGLLVVGVGGGEGGSPSLIICDAAGGGIMRRIDLGEFFGHSRTPPSVALSSHGIVCGHPDYAFVVSCTFSGEVQWVNSDGYVVGLDADRRSFMHGVETDTHGFSYVNTPGTSARCGIIGPGGRGLFRVILTQLPGLRVASAVPMLEGLSSDGIYFVTYGGDRPYIFHVPYTVISGVIVPEETFVEPFPVN